MARGDLWVTARGALKLLGPWFLPLAKENSTSSLLGEEAHGRKQVLAKPSVPSTALSVIYLPLPATASAACIGPGPYCCVVLTLPFLANSNRASHESP